MIGRRLLRRISIGWLTAAILPIALRAETVRATVEAGVLTGSSDGSMQTFKGVPYAAPPVGAHRWRSPQPVPHWTGTREANAFGAACLQAELPENIDGAPSRIAEDCLTLNIWAPVHAAKPLPVMVWLHGGGNVSGAGSKRYYDGTSFARDGVVLVTINYRLGALGFFPHPALTREAPREMPGNFGLLDQIAALGWVRRNIRAFGGNPENVTLFGESAGGQDALVLMTSPLAAGLFQKAIVESAGFWMHLPSRAEAEEASARIAAKAGLPAAASAAQLRAIPAEALCKLADQAAGPFVDGRVIPMQPAVAFAKGKEAHIPFIIGWNTDESSLVDGPEMQPASVLAFLKPEELAQARTLYNTGSDDAILARAVFRDANFAAPSRWVAQEASAQAKVYLYRFAYVRQRQVGRMPGAPHGSEIPYVFDSWRQSPTGGSFLAERDRAEAATLHGCWVAFAKEARPACRDVPVWPAYRKKDDELLDFGSTAVVARGLNSRELNFIEDQLAHFWRAP